MKFFAFIFLLPAIPGLSQEAESSIRVDSSLKLLEVIEGSLSPKSVVHSGNGYFFSQHMMYKHKITVHDRNYQLIATISDKITPEDYGEKGGDELRGAPVECVFSHQGKYAWVSNYNMTGEGFSHPGCDNCRGDSYDSSYIYKINVQTQQIENIIAAGAVPKFMAVSPDNEKLIVSNWTSGDISIINLATEKEIKKVSVGSHPRGIVISKDSKKAYVAIMGSSRISVVDLENYSKYNIKEIGKNPRHICISPDGNYLFISVNGEGKILKYDLTNGKIIKKIRTGRMPRSMALSSSGDYLYVVNYGSNSMTKVDARNFEILDNIETKSKPIGITVDNEKGTIWVACYSGKLMVYQDLNFNVSIVDQTILALGNPADFIPTKTQEVTPTPSNARSNNPTEIKVEEKTSPTKIEIENIPASSDQAFHIIAGSFGSRSNAKNEAARWKQKGYQSMVIKSPKGMNLISIKASNDKQGLVESLNLIKQTEKNGLWIYSKL